MTASPAAMRTAHTPSITAGKRIIMLPLIGLSDQSAGSDEPGNRGRRQIQPLGARAVRISSARSAARTGSASGEPIIGSQLRS